jgi:hypothetical protein
MRSARWQKKAEEAAAYVKEHLLKAHHGAVFWEPGVIALFGNNGCGADDRAKREVEAIRRRLPSALVEELAFTTSPEGGYTWVLLVKDPAPMYQTDAGKAFREQLLSGALRELVWDACREARGTTPDSCSGVSPTS